MAREPAIAILGETGSGKSCLVGALLNLELGIQLSSQVSKDDFLYACKYFTTKHCLGPPAEIELIKLSWSANKDSQG